MSISVSSSSASAQSSLPSSPDSHKRKREIPFDSPQREALACRMDEIFTTNLLGSSSEVGNDDELGGLADLGGAIGKRSCFTPLDGLPHNTLFNGFGLAPSPLNSTNLAIHDRQTPIEPPIKRFCLVAPRESFKFTFNTRNNTYSVTTVSGETIENVEIRPLELDEDADIFVCSIKGQDYFVKPGAKRFDEHNSLVTIATLLNLERVIAPVKKGKIDQLQYPHTFTQYDTSIAMSNTMPNIGADIFSIQEKLEGPDFHDLDQELKDRLLFACIALGINDVKPQDIAGGQIIDVEECMVTKPDARAFSHLPLLADESFHQPLEPSSLTKIKGVIKNWNIGTIIDGVKALKPKSFNETLERQASITQHCTITDAQNSELLPGIMRHDHPLFAQSRVNALQYRLEVIKGFVESQESFSLAQLAFHVDPEFKACYDKRDPALIKELIAKIDLKIIALKAQIITTPLAQIDGESKKSYKKRHTAQLKAQNDPLNKKIAKLDSLKYGLNRSTDGNEYIFRTCGSRDEHFDLLIIRIQEALA
jgi:hypothetical protein